MIGSRKGSSHSIYKATAWGKIGMKIHLASKKVRRKKVGRRTAKEKGTKATDFLGASSENAFLAHDHNLSVAHISHFQTRNEEIIRPYFAKP
jgi:hypothetical protein